MTEDIRAMPSATAALAGSAPSHASLSRPSAPVAIAEDARWHNFATDGGFGFGNDPAPHLYVSAYRDAMTQDGWSIRPTYASEPQESAATLERGGFKALILTRDKGPNDQREARNQGLKQYETTISIWGPDRLSIRPPLPYSFEACVAATSRCHSCGASGVPTERVGFAGRVCAKCLPAARAKIETPGWCD